MHYQQGPRGHGTRRIGGEIMTWFREQRFAWIKESVEIFGYVNRAHISKKFGISHQAASEDIREVQARWPDLMDYDLSGKRYVKRIQETP